MAFAVFAVLAVAWSLAVMRWAFSLRRGSGKTAVQVLSCAALIAAVISTAFDLRAMQVARGARSSDLDVRVIRRGDWWQLVYARDGVSFTTANELHVPAGEQVALTSSGPRLPSRPSGHMSGTHRLRIGTLSGVHLPRHREEAR